MPSKIIADVIRFDKNASGASELKLADNSANALEILQGSTSYLKFVTTDSAEKIVFGKAVEGLQSSSSSAAAITAARVLTLADAGGVFNIDQDAAFDIDLPSPTTGAGCRYTFVITDAGANAVTITVTDGAATFVGTIANDVTSVLPATGATLTFVSGTAAVGDSIEIVSLTTGLYFVRAISSAAGGITVA
jgi:hypothetical protein